MMPVVKGKVASELCNIVKCLSVGESLIKTLCENWVMILRSVGIIGLNSIGNTRVSRKRTH